MRQLVCQHGGGLVVGGMLGHQLDSDADDIALAHCRAAAADQGEAGAAHGLGGNGNVARCLPPARDPQGHGPAPVESRVDAVVEQVGEACAPRQSRKTWHRRASDREQRLARAQTRRLRRRSGRNCLKRDAACRALRSGDSGGIREPAIVGQHQPDGALLAGAERRIGARQPPGDRQQPRVMRLPAEHICGGVRSRKRRERRGRHGNQRGNPPQARHRLSRAPWRWQRRAPRGRPRRHEFPRRSPSSGCR